MTTKIIPDNIPSLEEIKDDLNAIIGMAKDLKTYDDIKKFESEHVTKDFEWVEINGEMVKDFNPDTPIEWIRIDCYGCLNYIYFFWNDKLSDKRIMFDVFVDDDYVDYLVQDISPDDLTEENYNKWVNDYMEKRGWL